ncbi:tyrosine-type recombinase/integrase [Verrucomicrobiota bacterium]
MSESKGSRKQGEGQSDSQHRRQLRERMKEVGFVAGTRVAYLREFDRFEKKLDRKTAETATVRDGRRYLSRLKQSGVSQTVYSHAAAALRFFFQEVRGLEWNPISALRQRMIDDMHLHGFSPKTQASYVRSVEGLTRYHMRSPDQLSEEDIRQYFVHLTCERKLARPTVTIALCGIKFFYEKTLKRDWSLTGVPTPKREKKVPVVLTHEQVKAILACVRTVRHRACLSLIYACGLRLSEACQIKVPDIDRVRGLLRVGGKGRKQRYVPLPEPILPLLEDCWRSHRNKTWLFPWVGRGGRGRHSRTTDRHVPIKSVQQAFRMAYHESAVTKKASVHSLRHAYATNLLEKGVSLAQIQEWLGHSSPKTTSIYAHLTAQSVQIAAQTVTRLMADVATPAA